MLLLSFASFRTFCLFGSVEALLLSEPFDLAGALGARVAGFELEEATRDITKPMLASNWRTAS